MVIAQENKAEIERAKDNASSTLRPTVPELEAVLFEPIPVLDHGFIRVLDYMGDDSAVVQAARVSFGRGTKQRSEDRGLIRYLMRHSHTTPFEMAEIKFHVKLPIFVARQWVRHRTANINEYSARYSILDKEFYIPGANRLAAQGATNRQGSGVALEGAEAARVLEILRTDAERNYRDYVWMLNSEEEGLRQDTNRVGLARELARMNLTLNTYTQWYWKVDLHNLLAFVRLRADEHAQYEIQAYANVILNILEKWVPLTYEAFLEYRFHSVTLSKTAVRLLQRVLVGEKITETTSGLAHREWVELTKIFELNKRSVAQG
jgi:thymidylate synthase (FAD)